MAAHLKTMPDAELEQAIASQQAEAQRMEQMASAYAESARDEQGYLNVLYRERHRRQQEQIARDQVKVQQEQQTLNKQIARVEPTPQPTPQPDPAPLQVPPTPKPKREVRKKDN